MKRILAILAAMLLILPTAKADEGMWLLPLLEKMNRKSLREAGCRLSPKEIYNINKSSLKDAVVQFGGGCTGEVVSSEGLLLTNHHCGYSSIQRLSSVEHDYLNNGYWAMSRSEELPCEGLSVTFLQYMTDITEAVRAIDKEAEAAAAEADDDNKEEIKNRIRHEALARIRQEAESNAPHCRAEIYDFYESNVYYLIVYKTYRDIRFVGAPPSSIGKFGADTDNWMWPRHTCDFSMFRIYADREGNPAAYSADNVPLNSPDHLKISLKGVKENDYTMIMGYPGSTTRFQTSSELETALLKNDIRIAARTLKQNSWMEDMLADPAIKIKYASKYASSSNGWKKWQGMKLAVEKLGIVERAKADEDAFAAWVGNDPARLEKYGTALEDIRLGMENMKDYTLESTLLVESILSIELIQNALSVINSYSRRLKEGCDSTEVFNSAVKGSGRIYKDYSAETDRKAAKELFRYFIENCPESKCPQELKETDIDAFIDGLYGKSVFTSYEKLCGADRLTALGDPASAIAASVLEMLPDRPGEAMEQLMRGRKAYTAGLLEWKDGQPMYPDANFTMRLTYGHVLPYSPKDGVDYRYYTTLEGVMEKEDPDNWEFVVPEKLKELYRNKDYGQYAMKDGRMPCCFLSNNDITGGNSGSPIMNAKGELIGLAFDGNWESMSSDIMFEPELQRCINVDIRYVLFIIDKFGGAGYLLDEMTIIK